MVVNKNVKIMICSYRAKVKTNFSRLKEKYLTSNALTISLQVIYNVIILASDLLKNISIISS